MFLFKQNPCQNFQAAFFWRNRRRKNARFSKQLPPICPRFIIQRAHARVCGRQKTKNRATRKFLPHPTKPRSGAKLQNCSSYIFITKQICLFHKIGVSAPPRNPQTHITIISNKIQLQHPNLPPQKARSATAKIVSIQKNYNFVV